MVFDDTPSNPECLYSECKSELQEWVLNKTQNSTWLRVGYQFSAFDPQHKLFPMLLNEKTPNLRNPNRKYDFIHVSDVARAIQRVLKVDLPRKILISNGRSYSSTEIARALGIRHTISANEDAFEQKTFPIFLKSLPWEPIYSEVSSFRNALNSEVNK